MVRRENISERHVFSSGSDQTCSGIFVGEDRWNLLLAGAADAVIVISHEGRYTWTQSPLPGPLPGVYIHTEPTLTVTEVVVFSGVVWDGFWVWWWDHTPQINEEGPDTGFTWCREHRGFLVYFLVMQPDEHVQHWFSCWPRPQVPAQPLDFKSWWCQGFLNCFFLASRKVLQI